MQNPSRDAGTDACADNKTREKSLPEFHKHPRCFKWFLSLKLGLASTITALGFGLVFKDDLVAVKRGLTCPVGQRLILKSKLSKLLEMVKMSRIHIREAESSDALQ